MRKAKYDEVQGAWRVDKQQPAAAASAALRRRPMSAAGLKRPTSNYVKMAAATGSNNLRRVGFVAQPWWRSWSSCTLNMDLLDFHEGYSNSRVSTVA